jgi:type I restriction enzyme, R subunit
MDAFGEFINNHSLSPSQNAMLNRIVGYVEQNGYIQFEQLTRPPFDRPRPLISVFGKELNDLKICIDRLNRNALVPAA